MSAATLTAPVEAPAPAAPPDVVHIVVMSDDEVARWFAGDPTVAVVALCGWVAPPDATMYLASDKPECPECVELNVEGL